MRIFFLVFLTAASSFLAATVSFAENIGLVIGNRTYQRASWMYDAEKVLNSADALRRAGYTVSSGRDMSALDTQKTVAEALSRLNDAERFVVILSGHFVHSGRNTWLVPVDAPVPDLANIAFIGLSLNTVLEMAAQKPGGAAVFLGTFPRPINVGAGLVAGIGALDIPQGVFVATGEPADIDQTVRLDFLKRGAGFTQALSSAPDSVKGAGFVSDLASLSPYQSSRRSERELAEQGYWQAVRDLDNTDAMRSYLGAYPDGAHVAEAQNWLAAHRPLSPLEIAQKAEAALALSRDKRRAVQGGLSLLGYSTNGIDGIFGRASRLAISNWQRDHGFTPNGYLNREQISALSYQAQVRERELADEARRQQQEQERQDRNYWQSSGASSGNETGLREYLWRYPDGLFAAQARAQLNAIERAKRDAAARADREAWDRAVAANTIESYQAYLDQRPSGNFRAEAQGRIRTIRRKAKQDAHVAELRATESALGLDQAALKEVERKLKVLRFFPGPVDGVLDKKTRQAIRKFQKTQRKKATGYLNQETMLRLMATPG